MTGISFSVLGPLMGGHGSQAFLGCVHEATGPRPVVMVFLPDEVTENPDMLRHLLLDTQAACAIEHVNVNAVRGIVRLEEGCARLVDFADAESMRSVYTRAAELGTRVPVGVGLALLCGACMGVHYAHELGIAENGRPLVHGGLRPETLLVGFHGVCKVTGYGAASLAALAQKLAGQSGPRRDAYTAIEQHYGGVQAATVHSDVYALGAILYEAATGKAPAQADVTDAEQHLREELLQKPHVGLTEKLALIVMHAMRKRGTDRFDTALAMRDAILETGACASQEEVARFMGQLFPLDFPSRAARNHMLAQARTAVPSTRAAWVRLEDDALLARLRTPAFSSPRLPPVPLALPAPPPAGLPTPNKSNTHHSVAPWMVAGLALGLAAALGTYVAVNLNAPTVAVRPAPVLAPAEIPAAPPVTPPVSPPVASPPVVAPPSTGQPAHPLAAPPKPVLTQLAVTSKPSLDLWVDGVSVGRGAVTLNVTPGTHTLVGKDKSLGVEVNRRVTVESGVTRPVALQVGSGNLVVEAPPHCEVYLDGKRVGTTPMGPLLVYEGRHTALVKHGTTPFKQAFVMKPDFDMTLHVEFSTEPHP